MGPGYTYGANVVRRAARATEFGDSPSSVGVGSTAGPRCVNNTSLADDHHPVVGRTSTTLVPTPFTRVATMQPGRYFAPRISFSKDSFGAGFGVAGLWVFQFDRITHH